MKAKVCYLATLTLGYLVVACSEQKPATEPVVQPTPDVKQEPVKVQPKVTPKKPASVPDVAAKPATNPVKKGSLTSVDVTQVFTMTQTGKALLVDVRPPLFYRLGHIDGAESLPLIRYDKVIEVKRPLLDAAVKSGKVIILYCQNVKCPDAHKTGLKLIELGYSVSVYRGGWEEWKETGL